MATKPNKVVTYLEELPLIESHKTFNKQGHEANQKHVSTITMLMATKPGRNVSHGERLSVIKLHHHLNNWLLGVIWEIRYIISPIAEDHGHQIMQSDDLP